ncbi:MAG: NUDIX hydrolase [Planctomycetes bacterium]|nr:NUDIX hydrolase [Planctomycetota bacterium]
MACDGESPRLLAAGDPRLAPRSELEHALGLIRAFRAPDPEQAAFQRQILAFCAEHPDALWRTCLTGHLTASALIVSHDGRRGLLCLHKKLGRWLQLGGHVDGDANLPAAALREAVEESGIPDLCVDPRPIDLDAHRIPARAEEPEHWHLDVRFRIVAPSERALVLSEESLQLRWFERGQLASVEADASVRRLFDRLALPG